MNGLVLACHEANNGAGYEFIGSWNGYDSPHFEKSSNQEIVIDLLNS